mmetsp:Transcript_3563/g.13639  ORF Transcript_3563/g.13639 Transcript_3563/m.13639 type:complete len:276 (-) Transcript_3563:1441-2268(-)
MSSSQAAQYKVGILGFGHLGQYLAEHLAKTPNYEISFIWNRSPDKIPDKLPILRDEPKNFKKHFPQTNLIIEVAHPLVTKQNIHAILQECDFICGSPTVFAEMNMQDIVNNDSKYGLYVPVGAMWGANDIQKMHQVGSLTRVKVTMKKHPRSLKLSGEIGKKMAQFYGNGERGQCVLYDGPVGKLCPMAPNNVNTMACAALAGLGFEKTEASLVADDRLEAHIIDIVVEGKNGFKVETSRFNPALTGAVTGQATYGSFLTSLLKAHSLGAGIHFV